MDQVDITIVGAGLSGLIAAREAKKRGYSVKVLEARSRVGGRMFNQITPSGGIIDLGGQWGGKTHYRLESLTDELGLQRHPSFYKGKGVFIWNSEKVDASPADFGGESVCMFNQNDLTNISATDKSSYISLRDELITISKTVPKADPWLTPNAQALDEIPISQWLSENNATPFARWAFGWLLRGGLGTTSFEPFEASLLHLAWCQAVGPQIESPESWLITKGAGEVVKIIGGRIERRHRIERTCARNHRRQGSD